MKQKNILIAPLDWGLGHASRDIPLIRSLIKHKFNVIIAGKGASGELLKKEFPQLTYLNLSSFSIAYPKSRFFILKILLQLPKIVCGIAKEYKTVQKYVKAFDIDLLISDNRYGVYASHIPSVFITHQVLPGLPAWLKIFEKLLFRIHLRRIKKFDRCFIPDAEIGDDLSGKLSHRYRLPENFNYIGLLSRFSYMEASNKEPEYDMLVILSGPEPQRSILERKLMKQLKNASYKTLFLRGKPNENTGHSKSNIVFKSHLPSNEMQRLIANTRIVICRSGYSSIMDLVCMKKKAIIIPTPGQSEQEYLAEYLKEKGLFVVQKQDSLNIAEAIKKLDLLQPDYTQFPGFKEDMFINSIKSLL